MKKFLFFAVAVLLVGRMTAQTIDTIDLNTQNEVPTVILLDSDFDESSTSVNDASTLLNSSRDVFNSIAAYNFGSLRYRVRGNDSKYSEVMINGISMNDPETGRPVFSNWGGLNDAFRNSVLVEYAVSPPRPPKPASVLPRPSTSTELRKASLRPPQLEKTGRPVSGSFIEMPLIITSLYFESLPRTR